MTLKTFLHELEIDSTLTRSFPQPLTFSSFSHFCSYPRCHSHSSLNNFLFYSLIHSSQSPHFPSLSIIPRELICSFIFLLTRSLASSLTPSFPHPITHTHFYLLMSLKKLHFPLIHSSFLLLILIFPRALNHLTPSLLPSHVCMHPC